MSLDVWHHLAFTWDRAGGSGNGTLMAYLDGVLVGSLTNQNWDSYTIDAARFGKEISTGSRLFAGSADELAIFNRALTGDEVAAQFAAAFGIPEPATATLGLLSFAGLMLRRRRMA